MCDESDPFRTPTDEDITKTEQRLGTVFHPDYREFLRTGGRVPVVRFRTAIILPGAEDRALVAFAETFWQKMKAPRHLLPIIENDGDFFCITPDGQIVSWSSERQEITSSWRNLSEWNEKVCSSGL